MGISRDSEDRVPSQNSTDNGYAQEVIGNKTDTVAGDSVIALIKQALAAESDIQADIGDPSARTNLKTILALLGNPDTAGASLYDNIGDFIGQTNLQSLLAALGIPDTAGKPLYTCLITDRLDEATFGLEALKNRLEPTVASATFSYLDAGGTQDMVEVVNTHKVKVNGIFVDCNTLTQNGILKFWTKIDGSTYRMVQATTFTVASDDSIFAALNLVTDKDFKFTWEESGGDEGAARDLPYKLSYEVLN